MSTGRRFCSRCIGCIDYMVAYFRVQVEIDIQFVWDTCHAPVHKHGQWQRGCDS